MKSLNSRQQLYFIITLCYCLFIVVGISACSSNNSTPSCDYSVVNVNSCNSSINTQATAVTLDNTAHAQATTQANLNATATTLSKTQASETKNKNVVSNGEIIIPLALSVSFLTLIFLFFVVLDKPNVSNGITIGAVAIITILLLIMTIFIFS